MDTTTASWITLPDQPLTTGELANLAGHWHTNRHHSPAYQYAIDLTGSPQGQAATVEQLVWVMWAETVNQYQLDATQSAQLHADTAVEAGYDGLPGPDYRANAHYLAAIATDLAGRAPTTPGSPLAGLTEPFQVGAWRTATSPWNIDMPLEDRVRSLDDGWAATDQMVTTRLGLTIAAPDLPGGIYPTPDQTQPGLEL
jgi:hypothetical protein